MVAFPSFYLYIRVVFFLANELSEAKSFLTFIPLDEMAKNVHKNKYLILHALAKDPSKTAAEAAREFGVNRQTIRKWCKEMGISLTGHKYPRIGFILDLKLRKRDRLLRELAVIEREVKTLRQQDRDAPYIKPKAGKK